MTPPRTASLKHAAGILVVASGIVAGTGFGVHAAELGFFEALFGGARQAPAVQPSQPAYDGLGQPRARMRQASRRHLRTRYAALPPSEPLKVKVGPRQTPLDMKAGAVAALMRDETLQPGDIVVLKTGARVFTGEPDKTHALRDFEPVERSNAVDRATRKQLAALMAPAAARPADQARRVVKSLKPETPALAAPSRTAMRVINPWIAKP